MLKVKTKPKDEPKDKKEEPKAKKDSAPKSKPKAESKSAPPAPPMDMPPVDMPVEEPPVDMPPPDMGMEPPAPDMGMVGGGKVDPSIVVYMSGDYGPFKCANCIHFVGPNSCDVVSGEIDPEGISHLFEPINQGPVEEPLPTEAEAGLEPEAMMPPPAPEEEVPLG